ncbi:MAG: hypothetical protein NDJ89_14125, partial [Oligoflexia bacterium]|nr:hypothetical protein [Oligoflexia bacterium]
FTGATGATGADGAQGFTGATGETGAQGAQGFTGATGETGAQGAQGFTGATGETGAQGAQGFTGATGQTGAQGAQGFTGATGQTGAQGLTGATGATGASPFTIGGSDIYYTAGKVGIGTTVPSTLLDVGIPGIQGAHVNIGNGSLGDTMWSTYNLGRAKMGYDGASMNAVIQGGGGKGIEFNVNNDTFGSGTAMTITSGADVGIGTTSPSAKLHVAGSFMLVNGTQGAGKILTSDNNGLTSWATPGSFIGATGATGAQGAQGFTGATGETGAQGAQGFTGATGETGAQGAQGETGATGETGAQGAQGFTGATGETGAQGVTGATGATGAQGAQGFTGATGATGASPFSLNGSNAYYSAGNVGIGTSTPTSSLEINVTALADGVKVVGANGPLNSVTNGTYTLDFGLATSGGFYSNTAAAGDAIIRTKGASSNGHLILTTQNATGSIRLTTGSTTMNDTAKMTILNGGDVGVGTESPAERLEVAGNVKSSGQMYATQSTVATGATVDFNTGNVQVVQAPGGSALTLNNMKDGGSYTVIITDTTSRTYTFTNCTNSHFIPVNSATSAGTRTIYTILKTTESSATHCYISWITGF